MKVLRCHGFDSDSKRELWKGLKQEKNVIRLTCRKKESPFHQMYRASETTEHETCLAGSSCLSRNVREWPLAVQVRWIRGGGAKLTGLDFALLHVLSFRPFISMWQSTDNFQGWVFHIRPAKVTMKQNKAIAT